MKFVSVDICFVLLLPGVWKLLEGYETDLATALQDALPSVTDMLETRLTHYLTSHNLTRVLRDVEMMRIALRLPGNCGEEARVKLMVQAAAAELAAATAIQKRQALQEQVRQDL